MPVTKITLSTAMRARDVSRPRADQLSEAAERELAHGASRGGTGQQAARPPEQAQDRRPHPAPGPPAAAAGPGTPGPDRPGPDKSGPDKAEPDRAAPDAGRDKPLPPMPAPPRRRRRRR